MANRQVSREEMLERVAVFRNLTSSSRPLVDAVLPQFNREIFNIIGGGVTEDATMKVPITAVEGFHMSIIKMRPAEGHRAAQPQDRRGLHAADGPVVGAVGRSWRERAGAGHARRDLGSRSASCAASATRARTRR